MPDEGPQNWKTNAALERLEQKALEHGRSIEHIIEAIDGKGRETGMRQDVRELSAKIDGRPPKYQDGVMYAIQLLGDNYSKLRGDLDDHVDRQNNEEANRSGRWKGAYTVYLVIGGFLTVVGGGVALLLSVRQAISQGLGGG